MNYFWDEQKMLQERPDAPSILAIGDSWFWYPFVGGSLVPSLGELVDAKGHTILACGNNGAEAAQYVRGKYAGQIRQALRLYGSTLEAVFISGGGNDFAGFNDLRPLLRDNCMDETTEEGCFLGGRDGKLREFFDELEQDYRDLIGAATSRTPPDCVVVMHTYAYARPDGRSVFGGGGWLKPALDDARVPAYLQERCVRYLLDGFKEMLDRVAAADTDFHVVDSRTALPAPSDWANELHPTADGFAKIARECWGPKLRALGLA